MIDAGAVAVSGTVPVLITRIPPGPASVVLSSSGTVYAGPGTGVTAANGFAVTSSPITFYSHPGSTGAAIYGLVGSGTVDAYWLVSTSQ